MNISILRIISILKDESYCLAYRSLSILWEYYQHDIDILCVDCNRVCNVIIMSLGEIVDDRCEICCRQISENQYQIDLFCDSVFIVRFDVYSNERIYENVNVRRSMIKDIISRRECIAVKEDENDYYIYVPSYLDELLYRYCEYLECYKYRADKIKHYKYVVDHLHDMEKCVSFNYMIEYYMVTDRSRHIKYTGVVSKVYGRLHAIIRRLLAH